MMRRLPAARVVAGAIVTTGMVAAWACGESRTLSVMQATYGPNCGVPPGNATLSVARACDGQSTCRYTIDILTLRDPAPGCAKAFQVLYRCTGDEDVRRVDVPGEAGFGSVAALSCRRS